MKIIVATSKILMDRAFADGGRQFWFTKKHFAV